MNFELTVAVDGQGLYEVTHKIVELVAASDIRDGLATIFIRHTSASLIIQENADPAVRTDLENWLNRLVPENDGLYTHTQEGLDDMPAHVKGALTQTHVSVPVIAGQLSLGTWQGIFVWEHRHRRKERRLIVNVSG